MGNSCFSHANSDAQKSNIPNLNSDEAAQKTSKHSAPVSASVGSHHSSKIGPVLRRPWKTKNLPTQWGRSLGVGNSASPTFAPSRAAASNLHVRRLRSEDLPLKMILKMCEGRFK
ncbi:hypothetical protein AAC387_Pa02g4639 [Persea americana]